MHRYPFLQILLAPLALLYGVGATLHEFLYRVGVLQASRFSVPTIVVGNLSAGGSGKTPHVEFLAAFLMPYISVGTLSRGYRRKTQGFRLVTDHDTAETVGDEPLGYRRKFPAMTVAVGENRAFAVPMMVGANPALQCILLDDAFQHHAVKAGLYILLTEYSLPFTRDYLLPSGRLRETRNGYRRADIIIVTKCPPAIGLTDATRTELYAQFEALRREIRPLAHQSLFFSYYEYATPYRMGDPSATRPLDSETEVVLICAIARTDYLLSYLEAQVASVRALEYTDHHYFEPADIGTLRRNFEDIASSRKIILTTEKDATRLELFADLLEEYALEVYVLPVRVAFHDVPHAPTPSNERGFCDRIVAYLEGSEK